MPWRRKRKGMTAGELMKKLRRDPKFREMQRRKAERHARDIAPSLVIEQKVLAELASVGVEAGSLADLRDRGNVAPEAVAVLLGWFRRGGEDCPPNMKIALASAVGAAAEPFDGCDLAREFDETDNATLRWTIANAISCSHPTGISEWLCARLEDTSLGSSREMLAIAAASMLEREQANGVLLRVFHELPSHCAEGLGASGGECELDFLQAQLTRYKGWVRREIEKAVSRIRRRLQSG